MVYGLLALAVLTLLRVQNKNLVIAGATALSLLILPVIIIATREALRSVPAEIREGSLALGATPLQTMWRQTLPSAVPGIATGAILALSRALGEAAPLLLLGGLVFVSFDPNGLLSGYTTLPIQIFNWTGRPQEEFRDLAAAASIRPARPAAGHERARHLHPQPLPASVVTEPKEPREPMSAQQDPDSRTHLRTRKADPAITSQHEPHAEVHFEPAPLPRRRVARHPVRGDRVHQRGRLLR